MNPHIDPPAKSFTRMLRSCARLILLALTLSSTAIAGHPCAHVLICCRGSNNGTTFEVNGRMIANHDYSDIGQTRDILQKIKDAGIQTVIIDMTNAFQWTSLWDSDEPKVDNIRKVTLGKRHDLFCLHRCPVHFG